MVVTVRYGTLRWTRTALLGALLFVVIWSLHMHTSFGDEVQGVRQQVPQDLFEAVLGKGECTVPRLHPRDREHTLTFYWYTLPDDYHKTLLRYWNGKAVSHGYPCNMGCSLCSETSWGKRGLDTAVRQMGTPFAITAKLIEYGRVTTDPKKADFIVVPAFTQLLWSSGWGFLVGTNGSRIESLFARHLPYLRKYPEKHIFFSGDEPSMHPLVRRQPIVVSLGPRISRRYCTPKGVCYGPRPWHIVVPDPHLLRATQPSQYIHNTNRTHLLFFFGGVPTHAPMRVRLIEHLRNASDPRIVVRTINSVKRGRQTFHRHLALTVGRKANLSPPSLREFYNSSKFCLVTSGDLPHQTRFFEAVLHGCLPALISYNSGTDEESWWRDSSRSAEISLFPNSDPHYPGLLNDSLPFTEFIPYKSFVVAVPYESFERGHFVDILQNMPEDEYRARLSAMLKWRSSFLFDMDGTAEDCFSLFLRRLADIKRRRERGESGGGGAEN